MKTEFKKRLQVVLIDDWELPGDGSGSMRETQFLPLDRLLEICERWGVRITINAEVMQQLSHLKEGQKHQELRKLSDDWERILKDAYKKGHDCQLHLHCQWYKARYIDGVWKLGNEWSLAKFKKEEIKEMVVECRRYIEALLKSVDPTYECLTFRAGSWCIAPSDWLLDVLADEKFLVDLSIVRGAIIKKPNLEIDFTECKDRYFPYYPDMGDARKLSRGKSRIICVPTASVRPKMLNTTKYLLEELFSSKNHEYGRTPIMKKRKKMLLAAKWMVRRELMVGDIAELPFVLMKQIIDEARKVVKKIIYNEMPVLLESHTKYIKSYKEIEKFVEYLKNQDDVDILTVKELCNRIGENRYPIMTAIQ